MSHWHAFLLTLVRASFALNAIELIFRDKVSRKASRVCCSKSQAFASQARSEIKSLSIRDRVVEGGLVIDFVLNNLRLLLSYIS